LEVTKWLLEKGMDVNIRAVEGKQFTPLIRASRAGRAELVGLLLEKGADKTQASRTVIGGQ
jgi:ankyrin repeat protein